MKNTILKLILLGFVIFSSCKKESIDAISDNEKLAQLRADIETLAKNKACPGSDNCKVVGIGDLPCGGPSWYVIYSLSNTDEKQLMTKVNEYTELQKAYNLKNDFVGTCIVLPIPTVDCKNGVCSSK
jgi:hypothetical protein